MKGKPVIAYGKQNRSTEGCSKLKRSVDMTSSGKNCLNTRTNASPKYVINYFTAVAVSGKVVCT